MSIGLSLQNHSRWKALVAHTLWEGFMVRTIIVHLIAKICEWDAILAFLVWLVLAFALCLNLAEVMLKAFVLNLFQVFVPSNAIRTFF